MQAQAPRTLCSSAPAGKVQQPGAKPAAPLKLAKQLLGSTAGALATAGATAGAASAADLPSVSLPSISLPDVDIPDVSGLLDGVDPLLVGGGLAAVAIPVALVALLGGGSNSGPKAKAVPAARALEALAADDSCILLDIRSKADVRATGVPNLKGVTRRGAVSLPYTVVVKGEEQVDGEFASKVARVKGIVEGGPVILLDSAGADSPAAAKAILAELPLDKLYYVQGGADAWQTSGGPWREPSKGLNFDFDLPDISAALSGAGQTIAGGVSSVAAGVAEAPEAAKGALVFGAVVGASALLFTQLELLFELAGLLAAGQFLLKVAFAEDREKTLTEIKKVVDEVDIPDLPQDLSKITSALLEDPTASPTEVKRAKAAAAAAVASASSAPAPKPAPVQAPVTPPAAATNGSGAASAAAGEAKVPAEAGASAAPMDS